MNFQSFGQTVKGHSRDLEEKVKGKTEQARKVRAKPVGSNQLGAKMQLSPNNRRKRALRSLAGVCHVAAINPWSDTTITFNASDEHKFRTARAPAALVLRPIMDGFRLTKVIMDGGSGLNLIYEETLQKMEIDWNGMSKVAQPLEESSPVGSMLCRENHTRRGIRHAG